MPSLEPTKLVEIFDLFETAATFKSKSDLLTNAKYYIFNEMSVEDLRQFFIHNQSNFENLFLLDIWTKSLEDSNGIVEFLEPYDIIERIFQSLTSIFDLVNSFHDQTLFLLNQDKDEKVKHICVKHFLRLINTLDFKGFESPYEAKNDLELKLKGLMTHFVRQIPNTTVTYTQLLSELISTVSIRLNKFEENYKKENIQVYVFSCSIFDDNNELLNELEHVSKLGSTQKFRVFEIIANLACISNEHLVNISEAKLNLSSKINSFLNNQSDVLEQLNCIELICDLVRTSHGYEFIQKTGHLNHLIQKLEVVDDSNVYSSILRPSIVKFFACIARERVSQVKEHFPIFFTYLFKTGVDENVVKNLESISLSIETFCYLFEANLVKKFIIENFSTEFQILLERLVWMIKNSINDKLKTNSLKCVAELISADPSLLKVDNTDQKWTESPWITSEWINLSKSIYGYISAKYSHEQLFNLCLSIAKEPFSEKRHAAQLYFKAMAQTQWGLTLLFTPNKFNCEETFLNGYLLNRSIELEKEGLETKLELIKLIVANLEVNKTLINIIGDVAYEKLREYLSQGAFFAKSQAQVAFQNL